MEYTKHATCDRKNRFDFINKIGGTGNVVDTFCVNKGHRNGPEIHEITDNGIIIIYNQKSKKLITMLIARPGQIKRYYTNRPAPQNIVEIAYQHQLKHYNQK